MKETVFKRSAGFLPLVRSIRRMMIWWKEKVCKLVYKIFHSAIASRIRRSLTLPKGFFWFLLILTSCSTVKTIPVETIKEITQLDTLYLSNVQYDSIYIDRFAQVQKVQGVQEVPIDDALGKRMVRVDTLIKELTKYEYKYKLLRDTIYRTKIEVQRDSIPYEVRVVETKEVRYVPPWCKWLAAVGALALLLLVLMILRKVKVI